MSNSLQALTDKSQMPDRGQHFGKAMANIPAKDLIWLFENNKCSKKVHNYIKDNLGDLRNGK